MRVVYLRCSGGAGGSGGGVGGVGGAGGVFDGGAAAAVAIVRKGGQTHT